MQSSANQHFGEWSTYLNGHNGHNIMAVSQQNGVFLRTYTGCKVEQNCLNCYSKQLHLMCVFYLDVGALKAHVGISALLLCKLANTRAVDMVQAIFRSGIAGYLTNTWAWNNHFLFLNYPFFSVESIRGNNTTILSVSNLNKKKIPINTLKQINVALLLRIRINISWHRARETKHIS